MSDLLPNDLLTADIPDEYEARRVLDEIAAELPEKTDNMLYGEVRTRYPGAASIEHDFYLVQSVGNHSYQLFSVTHDFHEYPATIHGPGQGDHQCLENLESLRKALRDIFALPQTRKLIKQLARVVQ